MNRQLFYTPGDAGRPKVEVAGEPLAQLNPELRIRVTHSFLNSVAYIGRGIQGSDLVIRSLDNPPEIITRLNEACLAAGIPSLGGGFLTQGAVVGPTVIPGKTSCLSCNAPSVFPSANPGIGATFAPVVTTCAGLICGEAIAYLGELGPIRTAGTVMLIGVPTFAISFIGLPKNENCRACGQRARKAVNA